MMTLLRFIRIVFVCLRYGLDELALSGINHRCAVWTLRIARFGTRPKTPRAVRLRLALEALGPIFVKFGQVLSTRRDLIPSDIAAELAMLQDQVPPFASDTAARIVHESLGAPVETLFASFTMTPTASASIAQVHFATLHDGSEVAVKVLRPGMLGVIEKDLRLLRVLAALVQRLSPDGPRLKPREVVDEFDKYLHDELDLLREAANCSQLRRNFGAESGRSHLLQVPEVHWDYCTASVFTMERMHGIPVSHTARLREAGVDIAKLARSGVEIFFTQVFADGFFHADMHPGNILVSDQPDTLGRYIALDFGIVGSLSEFDKNYLAQNFLAFFQRDYRRVARLHIECGWAPADTREEEFEAAVRAVCEPHFDRPLAEISLGQVLLRLFQMSRRFNIEIQPQLVLLQKTLLNVEGMGRELDPTLDLWKTAKPYLENWMRERIGVKGWQRKLQQEAAQWSQWLPELPRLLHERLRAPEASAQLVRETARLARARERGNRWLAVLAVIATAALALAGWTLLR